MKVKIIDLKIDCLLYIFKYLSEQDLFNLCDAHWWLRHVIEDNIFYVQTLNLLMCGHRDEPRIQERTQMPLTYEHRIRVNRNWLKGRCQQYTRNYIHKRKLSRTKLILERNYLYVTLSRHLLKLQRLREQPLHKFFELKLHIGAMADIVDFAKHNGTIFVGRVDGNCCIYESGYGTEQQLHSPMDYVNCVDFTNDIYVTSTGCCGRIWRRSDTFGFIYLNMMSELKHSYKVLKLNAHGNRFYGGLYVANDVISQALREIDLESGIETILNSKTKFIFDLKLKDDDNIIFTLNIDKTLRMFDRRSNHDEAIWESDFPLSCLDYDGLYAVLCGSTFHNRINLYDIRVPDKHVQTYAPHSSRYNNAPIYSIACDSRYLFAATEYNLQVFDFKCD